jgi:hypothetical protein
MTVALERRWTDWRLLRRAAAAAAVALVVALPWSIPYLRVQREAEAGRTLFEAAQASAVPASYLQAPAENLLYGQTGWLRPGPGARLARRDGPEQALFPGFAAIVLALVGAAAAPRGLRRTAAIYATLGLVGVALSLGPNGFRSLYAALYESVFGMQAIRAPARFSVLVLTALAVLAAIGVHAIGRRTRRTRLVPIAALTVIALEYANGRLPLPPAPVLRTEVGAWLAATPGPGPVVCLPLEYDTTNTPCMLQSLEHGRPIVNGYSGLRPPFFPAVVDALSRMPSAESLLTLHDLGVQYIVSDRVLALPEPLSGAIVERARFEREHVYEVAWSPEVLAALTAADTGPLPPEPGRPPFAVGESATYQVRWTNGPMNIPAGEMTIEVMAPRESEAYRFSASAKTAPWVARFYEADARLETTATPRLLPMAHVEDIVEGRRRIERRVAFDAGARQVRITSGGPMVTLPLARDARDPVTALFYVRTIPLATDLQLSLPLSDNGRPSRLDVTVGPVESIVLGGRSWPAWRVVPRLRERVERRRPLEITTWISADARRLPLRIDIEAGFGSVRAELTTYRPQ